MQDNDIALLSQCVKEQMLALIKAACKKQREICLENARYGDPQKGEDMYSVTDESILDAPEPELSQLFVY
jgi:hypothetical protein